MAEDNTNYQSQTTFLIECSRADSLVDKQDGGDFNAKWTNSTNFNLRRGDRVSVEMLALNAKNAAGSSTIEFTGDNVVVDGEKKPYTDNKVLLEVFFYMNNNNTYSVGLPLIHPEGGFNGGSHAPPAQNPNRFQPVWDVMGGNKHYNAVSSFSTCANEYNADGYLQNLTQGQPPTLDGAPTQVYAIKSLISGTQAAPVFNASIPANTSLDVIGIELAQAGDPNPNGAILTSHNGYALQATGDICNIYLGSRLAIQTDTPGGAGVEYIQAPVSRILSTNGGRLSAFFDPQTIGGNPFVGVSAGQLVGIVPTTIDPDTEGEMSGSSMAGNVNYQNIDQTGMPGGSTVYRGKGQMLQSYLTCIGKPEAGIPANDPHAQFPTTTYGDAAAGNATTAYDYDSGKQGFRGGNLRAENDGKPYIFTRNDWYGIGAQKPNNKGYYPKLMPMTAFILLEAKELFTDLTTLANTINYKLHEALLAFDNYVVTIDNYLTNAVDYPNRIAKASSVIPTVNNFGWYPYQIYDNATYKWKQVHKCLWTDILPVKYGGCTKVQPANMYPGYNYVDGALGRQLFNPVPSTATQISIYEQDTYCAANITSGLYEDDRWNNEIYGNMGYANFYKMMLGDRWQRLPLHVSVLNESTSLKPAPANGMTRNIGKPVMINHKLPYFNANMQVGGTGDPFYTQLLPKKFLIVTNVAYPRYSYFGGGTSGQKINVYNNEVYEDFAKQLREYELYKGDKQNYSEQKVDNGSWVFDFDIGITDDSVPITNDYTNNVLPFNFRWCENPPLSTDPSAPGNQGTGLDFNNNPNRNTNSPVYRECISPAFSQRAFGDDVATFDWGRLWNAYRGIGRIVLESRYDPNWRTTTIQNDDIPGGLGDPACELRKSELEGLNNGEYLDFDLIESLNLPFYPVKYTNADGNVAYVVGLRVGADYTEVGRRVDSNNTLEESSYLTLGQMIWGITLGVSPSGLDNHAIVPMNGDQRNPTQELEITAGGTEKIKRIYRENQTPFVQIGANDPTFQYNQAKNRFEFVNLQTDNLLSLLNQANTSITTNPQVGEKCGIVHGKAADSLFNRPNPKTQASSTNNYSDTMQNQGIRSEIGGIGIFKIHLCPPDYEIPENINPVNYYDNSDLVATENNRLKIIEGCTEADDDNWEGCLLNRLGFAVTDFLPRYGRQGNRFDPNTYNNPNPLIIGTGVKPLLLNNSLDGTINPTLNLYYKFPLPGANDTPNGVPKFAHGFNENQEILVSTQSLPLTADDSPTLTDTPFFVVYSDIVAERNYQAGSTPLPAIFYCMKNYSSSGYLYGYGSSFQITVNQDRTLSQINTEIRNPTDGRLAKLSPNSVIIYKIQRNQAVPAPLIDAFGHSTPQQQQPDPNKEEIDAILNEVNKIGSAAGVGESGRTATGGAGRNIMGGGGNRMARITQANVSSEPIPTIEAEMVGEGRDTSSQTDLPPNIVKKIAEVMIKASLAKIPVGKYGSINNLTPASLERVRDAIVESLAEVDDTIRLNLDNDKLQEDYANSGEDMERFLMGILNDYGDQIRIGVTGRILRAPPARGGKEGQILIAGNTEDLVNALSDAILRRDRGRIEDLVDQAIQQKDIVLRMTDKASGLTMGISLTPDNIGEVTLRGALDDRDFVDEIIRTDRRFGGSGGEKSVEESKTGSRTESTRTAVAGQQPGAQARFDRLKEDKGASTAGSTTQPPSDTSSVRTESAPGKREPSGRPDEEK